MHNIIKIQSDTLTTKQISKDIENIKSLLQQFEVKTIIA